MTGEELSADVVIAGGGVAGVCVALQLMRNHGAEIGPIAIFEPRARLGAGLAYDTDEPAHRLNVAAHRMNLFPDRPGDFAEWFAQRHCLDEDPGARAPDGQIYARRLLFGRYMQELIAPYVESGAVRHIRERVAAVTRTAEGWRVTGAGGSAVSARFAVLAVSHPPPAPPEAIQAALAGHPRFIGDPFQPDALSGVEAEDRVLVAGTGLTSADVLATLARRGHRGPVTAFSRRGLRSRPQAAVPYEPFGDFTREPARTALRLLRRIRAVLAEAEGQGVVWQGVFDALRKQGGAIWTALPEAERRRLVRHLRRYWDAHRFRLPPQTEAMVRAGIASGRVRVLSGEIESVSHAGEALRIAFRHRRPPRVETEDYDWLVLTTGPAHRAILGSQDWLRDMARQGFLRLDRVGLGLDCSPRSLAIGADGQEVPGLYVAGPLARGTFGELMGVPEVAAHAGLVADDIARHA